MGKAENTIESNLKEAVKEIGGTSRKWVSPGYVGVPDQIVFYKGAVVFAEIKTRYGKCSPSQIREIKRLKNHGAIVFVISTGLQIRKFIDYLLEKYGHA